MAADYDVIITNGRLLDGAGNPWRYADIGTRGDRIARVGDLSGADALEIIDASGLYIAPGFIDTHSHAREALQSADRSAAPGLLAQGVTTVLLNPDGGGEVDLEASIAALERDGLGVNAGLFAPHGSIRRAVMGMDARAPSPEELASMAELVESAMASGAFGLSSGLYYAPGSFAENSELIALARVVAPWGGAYQSHIRDESDFTIGLAAAVDEVIEVSRDAGVPGVITHIKALGPPVWGLSEDIARRIRQARADGIPVYTDQYPYEASSTNFAAALLPRWAFAEGKHRGLEETDSPELRARLRTAFNENLARRGGPDRIVFSRTDNTALLGKSLAAVASGNELTPFDMAMRILRDGNPGIISFNMNDEDIETFMREEWNMTASDGAYPVWEKGRPHPRAFGSFPRKLRKYVIEDRVISLPFAIRSMTSLPADVYGIQDRGRLAEGAFADIIVFDIRQIRDNATFVDPWQLSGGVVHVLVNGEPAWRNGRQASESAGRVLKNRVVTAASPRRSHQ